jgi:hypothetical protein
VAAFGSLCVQRYATLRKNPVISHEAFLVSLAQFCASQALPGRSAAEGTLKYAAGFARVVLPLMLDLRAAEIKGRAEVVRLGAVTVHL